MLELAIAPLLAHEGSHEMLPVHPILVTLTAALVPASVVSDVLGKLCGKADLHVAAWWMLLYAAIATPLTAAAGWLWLGSMPGMDHDLMTVHQWLGTALALVLVGATVWRSRAYRAGTAPSTAYVATALVLLLAVVFQGHIGGKMTFGGHEPAPASSASTEHHH